MFPRETVLPRNNIEFVDISTPTRETIGRVWH